ncbi:MAG TPA: hypothetical protein PLL33_04100, partial [Paracoccus sp. (in: a-proteobacteria)]|nr:hypothetical protein [Paracoccus sp. (in: a-proteobacteria)]
MTRLFPALFGGFCVMAAPFLAGLGGAGGWSVGVFAVLTVLHVVLMRDPRAWTNPGQLAAAAAINGVTVLLLWGAGRGVAAATGALLLTAHAPRAGAALSSAMRTGRKAGQDRNDRDER